MGREVICQCDWAGVRAEVKALLETSELIVRGPIRKRARFNELNHLRADDGRLCFSVEGEAVALFLGAAVAEKWVAAIKSPPTLAKKLGITGKTVVRIIGNMDEALASAVAEAGKNSAVNPNLILAQIDTPESLQAVLKAARAQLATGVPLWLAYAKGPGHPLSESSIRSILRELGMIDTKVASVSAQLTATRFNMRKS